MGRVGVGVTVWLGTASKIVFWAVFDIIYHNTGSTRGPN